METKKDKIVAFLKRHYPILTTVGILFVIYIPYLSGKYILVGPGALTRGEIWNFLFSPNFGWIDFYKNMGEFVGGMYHYGFFNPIQIVLRLIHFPSAAYAEYFITIIYASATFFGAYWLFRKLSYAKWIAILSASIFALNGQAFTTDVNTSESFANLLYLPFMFILAEGGFKGIWRKLAFGLLVFLEASNSTPQYIIWQIVIIGLYLIYLKGRKAIWPYFGALVFAIIALIPQISLTQIIYSGYDVQNLVANPHLLGWPGNPLSYIFQIINPFSPLGQYGYLTPYYYTALIGTLIFIYFIPNIIRKWRETPKSVKFFFVATLFFLIASFAGSPLQDYFLAKLPFVSFILSRNPYRYVYFYFFSLSFVVAYCLQNYLAKKEQLVKFAKALSVFGSLGVLGYIAISIAYQFFNSQIFNVLNEHYITSHLSSVRGGYDPLYYVNLLKMYFELYIPKSALFSWSGIFSALPYFSFLIYGFAIIKNKIKEPLKYLPHFILINVILTGFIFSAVLAQDARLKPEMVFDQKENNLALTIKEEADWRNSYIMSYGNYAGEIYLENLYNNSAEIYNWLSVNQYTNHTDYSSIPRIQNEVLPVRLFKDQLLGTYLGFQLVDLFKLAGQFPDNQKSNPLLLNELASDKDLINPEKMDQNLSERVGILRNIGVRYVVSQYEFKVPGIKMIQKLSFGEPSDLLPNYTATLYLYKLNNPGKIVFVPKKVRLVDFGSIDIMDFAKVKETYDNLNFKDISIIEYPKLINKKDSVSIQTTEGKDIAFLNAGSNIIAFKTDLSADSYIIINNYYYAGWRAFIDGVETPVGRANLMFMAIKAPKGEHSVELKFDIWKMVTQSL